MYLALWKELFIISLILSGYMYIYNFFFNYFFLFVSQIK